LSKSSIVFIKGTVTLSSLKFYSWMVINLPKNNLVFLIPYSLSSYLAIAERY
jgi:hypothetical protein